MSDLHWLSSGIKILLNLLCSFCLNPIHVYVQDTCRPTAESLLGLFTSVECIPQAQSSAEWIGGGDELKWITLQPENSFNAAGISVRPETHIRLSVSAH